MINCFDLIGKSVLSLCSGKIVGVVKNIDIEDMKLQNIFCFNDESEICEEFIVEAKDVFCFGENAITLKREQFCAEADFPAKKIVGSVLFSQEGSKIDNISDITFDEKTLKIIDFVGEEKSYKATEIGSINNGVIVLKGKAKLVKTPDISSIPVSTTADDNVKILINEIRVDKNALLNTEQEKTEFIKQPTKTYANYNFLIGRVICKQEIIEAGKIVLELGKVVDEKLVGKAFEKGFVKALLECTRPA